MGGVAPGVFRLVADNPGPMTLGGTCTYLLGSQSVTIVDPGPAGRQQMKFLARAVSGRPVRGILLTHAHLDHSGAAQEAAETFSAAIMASADTLERIQMEGHALADDERIEPGDLEGFLVALHTPGHSADHVSYALESRKAVFTGDLVLGTGSSAILYPDGCVSDYLISLERLASLDPELLLPGHGPPVEDAAQRLAEYSSHRSDRERQIVFAVRSGASTLAAVREDVYGALEPGLDTAAELSICAHLHNLRKSRPSSRDEDERLRALREECSCKWGQRPPTDH